MKYKRFGKWVFDSVVCLADKDELSSKDSKKMKHQRQERYEQ
jgi:hypothetical protein